MYNNSENILTTMEPLELPRVSAFAWSGERSLVGSAPGSVLFVAGSTAFQSPGGGELQFVQTGKALESLGVDVQPFSHWRHKLSEAGLVHIFGMSREGLEIARFAKALGKPVVLSSIFWIDPRAMFDDDSPIGRRIAGRVFWSCRASFPWLPSWRKELLEAVDAVLPNTNAEAEQLVRCFGTDPEKIHVTPNGVEPRFAQAPPDLFRALYGEREFVLYVGRIEPRKNVHKLIEATANLGLELVVMGDPPVGRADYAKRCRELGGKSVRWIARVAHDDPILASAYSAARVVALVGWFETPGLAALEGGLAGARLAVTKHGGTQEYFGGHAHYADPADLRSIQGALERAWNAEPSDQLAMRILERFLWSEVARRTLEVYRHVGY